MQYNEDNGPQPVLEQQEMSAVKNTRETQVSYGSNQIQARKIKNRKKE